MSAAAHDLQMVTITHSDTPPACFFADEAEGGDYYRAFQESESKNFSFGYFTAYRGAEVICTVPYFIMDFSIATMLPEGVLTECLVLSD